jgi:hypothetical protein
MHCADRRVILVRAGEGWVRPPLRRPTPEQNPDLAHDPSEQTRAPPPAGVLTLFLVCAWNRALPAIDLARDQSFITAPPMANGSTSARDEAPWPSSFT